MEQINVILNGEKITAQKGETILEVAKRNGIFIPTLCNDNRLEPYGSCRVCLVKVKGAKAYMPACSTLVTEGMEINTEDDDIREARRMSLALLISDHFGDCLSPCTLECPANIDIQGYIALIKAGKYQEAVKLIKEKNPMPLTIGRVCPHPCESVCRRSKVEEPVAINNLKRFAADYDIAQDHPWIPEKKPQNGKKIAVIGAGPAGLSASYYLLLKGYGVTIFEKHPKPGGMLYYGIPRYRLPEDILKKEIDFILGLGAEIRYNCELGKDFSIEDLKAQGFNAVFLAIGAQKSIDMRIEGENLEGVVRGIDFLHQVAEGNPPPLHGKKVIVVGGGNTAMDASRTSLRLGAEEVIVLYRRTKTEMPANDYEIKEAEEEGVKFFYLAAPVKVIKGEKKLIVECIKMKLGEPDSSGRRRPIPIDGSNYTISTDLLITAIGQKPDTSVLSEYDIVTRWDTISADSKTGSTKDPFIFAGGDCVTGAKTAIEALAGGRKAAESIDRFLTLGTVQNPNPEEFNISKGKLKDLPDEIFSLYKKQNRVSMPTINPQERVKNFIEIEKGLDEKEAIKEASRCLECGCAERFSCALRDLSTLLEIKAEQFKGEKNIFPEYHTPLEKRPAIIRDENKCIKCGICVRICDEVWGLHIYGFVNRGFETEVVPYFNQELEQTACDFCGQCADACPTGALSLKSYTPKPGPFKVEKVQGRCIMCSLGCELDYNIYENILIKNTALPPRGENEGCLCVRGRFGYEYLKEDKRVTSYLEYKKNGIPVTITRQEAVFKALNVLNNSKRTAILTSTSLSNEEYREIYKLRNTSGKAEIYHIPFDFAEYDSVRNEYFIFKDYLFSNGKNYEISEFENTSKIDYPAFPVTGKTLKMGTILERFPVPTLEDIKNSSIIVLFNIFPGRSFPVLEMSIRKALKTGANLFIINSKPTRLDDMADIVFRIPREFYIKLWNLAGKIIYKQNSKKRFEKIPEETERYYHNFTPGQDLISKMRVKPHRIMEFIKKLQSNNKTCFICDEDLCSSEEIKSMVMAASTIQKIPGILFMQRGTNPVGVKKYQDKTWKVNIISQETLTPFDTILVYKLPGLFNFSGKKVVHFGFSTFKDYGDYGVFIPSSSLLESGGSIHLYDGRKIKLYPVLEKKAHIDNLAFLQEIVKKASGELKESFNVQ